MLQVGTALNAVVADKLTENNYLLKLSDGMQIRAQTLQALEPGQALRLEVVKTGVVPELKIVLPGRPTQPGQAALQQALRQFLPKQQNLSGLAGVLKQFAADLSAEKTGAVSAAAQDLLASIPTKDALMSADQVKHAVGNSGVFFEAKLANQLSPKGDLKGILLTLADALQKSQASRSSLTGNETTPKTTHAAADANLGLASGFPGAIENDRALLKTTESAIARIVLEQLSALPQDNETQQVWQIEIPYVDGHHSDAVKLKIKREDDARTETSLACWSVILEINPPGMGILHSKISLVDGKVDTYFWSDRQNTAADIGQNLDVLANSYNGAGLTVGNLDVLEGTPINTNPSDTPFQQPLLDEYL